jgi:hypothetical protein
VPAAAILEFGVFYLSNYKRKSPWSLHDSLFPCDFIVECTGVKLACVEAGHADHEAYERKLCPPIVPKTYCKQHGATAKDKMYSHVNCFLRQLVIRSEHCTGIIAKKRFELISGDSANEKRASEEIDVLLKLIGKKKTECGNDWAEVPVVECGEAPCLHVVTQEQEDPDPIQHNPPQIEPELSDGIINCALTSATKHITNVRCKCWYRNKALPSRAAGVVSLQRGKSPQTANVEGNLME